MTDMEGTYDLTSFRVGGGSGERVGRGRLLATGGESGAGHFHEGGGPGEGEAVLLLLLGCVWQ